MGSTKKNMRYGECLGCQWKNVANAHCPRNATLNPNLAFDSQKKVAETRVNFRVRWCVEARCSKILIQRSSLPLEGTGWRETFEYTRGTRLTKATSAWQDEGNRKRSYCIPVNPLQPSCDHNSSSRSPFDTPTNAFCIFFQN